MKFIKLENFRIFKNAQRLELKPITFLIGPNSSGKSTVVRAFEILKGLFIEPMFDEKSQKTKYKNLEILDLKKIAKSLGNFKKIISKDSKAEHVSFSLPFNYS